MGNSYYFTQTINSDRLNLEISSHPTFASYTIEGILTSEENVEILFTEELTPEEENTLLSIVSAHNPAPLPDPGVYGADSYCVDIDQWTWNGTTYFANIEHNTLTSDVIVQAFSKANNKTVLLGDIERISNNILRIFSSTNTDTLRIVVLKTARLKHNDLISSWTYLNSLFYSDVSHNFGTLDVIVDTYSSETNKTVFVEEVERLNVNTVRIWVQIEEDVKVSVVCP
ncbi:MAG: hypothetical protein WC511_03030 [Candidatus Pacearchaeota archaeon]